MSTPDLSKTTCDCGLVASRVYTFPRLMLYGGRGDNAYIPPDEEDKWMQKKHLDETTVVPDGFEWQPGKGVPERFQPNIK